MSTCSANPSMKKELKKRIRFIHWNPSEGDKLAGLIRSAGFDVSFEVPEGPPFLKLLQRDSPDAVVIDLSRLPAQGRDIGLAVRHYSATRGLPLVFVGGEPEKREAVRSFIPDAVFTSWEAIGESLPHALAHPPENPVRPSSLLEGYSRTPLVQKLGIRRNTIMVLVDAPAGFESVIGRLPEGAQITRRFRSRRDLTLWFVRSRSRLKEKLHRVAAGAAVGRLWIAWPKKSSGEASDLTQQGIRDQGLAAGWVDHKICSIDKTWAALLFSRRKARRPGAKA